MPSVRTGHRSLTSAQEAEVIALYRGSREPVARLAERFGVSRRTVYNILDRVGAGAASPPSPEDAERMLLAYLRVVNLERPEIAAVVAGVVVGRGEGDLLAATHCTEAFALILGADPATLVPQLEQGFLSSEVSWVVGAALAGRRGIVVLRDEDLDRGEIHTALAAARDLRLPVTAMVFGDGARAAAYGAHALEADSNNPLSVRDALHSAHSAGLGWIALSPLSPAGAFSKAVRANKWLRPAQIKALETRAAELGPGAPRD